MEAIAKGILSGLGYGLLIGPLFFLNIRVTLSQGLPQGLALVAGAFVSDFCLVLTSWWGAGQLQAISSDKAFQTWFGLICGLMLLGFGIAAAWPKKRDFSKEMTASLPVSKRRYAFLQGLLVNFSNPSNWLFWLSVATAAKSQAPAGDENHAKIFMIASLAALFSTDLCKVLLAHKIGGWLKPGAPEKIVQVAGIILIILSIWLLYKVYQGF
jgi:threonine/homoserine/homoserine lactone efflux protein